MATIRTPRHAGGSFSEISENTSFQAMLTATTLTGPHARRRRQQNQMSSADPSAGERVRKPILVCAPGPDHQLVRIFGTHPYDPGSSSGGGGMPFDSRRADGSIREAKLRIERPILDYCHKPIDIVLWRSIENPWLQASA